MKKMMCAVLILFCMILTACGEAKSVGVIGGADGPTTIFISEKGEKSMYEQITAEQAKKIMDSDEEFIVLDVREQGEFDSGHIQGGMLIPYT